MRRLNLVLLALIAVFVFAADVDAQRRGRGAGGPPGVSASAPPRDNSKQEDNQDQFGGPQNGNRQGAGNDSNQSAISFVNEVAPIIDAKCGRCHVDSSKGRFNIKSYEALMDSETISRNPDDSQFIEVIENGEMPKGGLTVTDDELKTLRQWIAEGANFDGNEESQVVSTMSGGGAQGNGGSRGNRTQGRGNGGSNNSSDTTDIIRKDPLLKIADVDGDGRLDWEELDMISRILHEMDWNNDGRLTVDEVNFGKARTNNDRDMAAQGRKPAKNADPSKPREFNTETEKQLFSFDRNNDGKLTRSELPGYLRSIMSTADKNKDRLLDEYEVADYAESVEADKK